jgi:hypothetical protein
MIAAHQRNGRTSDMDRRHSPSSRIVRLALGGVAAGVAAALFLVAAGTLLVDQTTAPPAPVAVAPVTIAPSSGAGYQITGFRTAQFGMKEAELREALARDFGVGPNSLTVSEAAGLGARTLSFLLDGLAPGAGVAQMDYVLGYQGRELIQISAIWGGAISPQTGQPQIDAAAAELKRYFRNLPFDPSQVAYDVRRPDGSLVLARARDGEGRIATLIRSEMADAAGTKRPSLQLLYVRDEKQPDVFRIKKGQF